MTKCALTVLIFFTFILLYGCGGKDCTYTLYRRQLKERMESSNCIRMYDTVNNKVYIEITDTLTRELLNKKVKLLK